MLNEKVVKINCTGCGLCASLDKKIQFAMNAEGYLRPVFPKGYNYRRLEKLCPIIYDKDDDVSKVWGDYNDVKKAYAAEKTINVQASSGGVISTILIWMLKKKIVDAIIQIGADKENPLKNRVYVSRTKEDILWCAGSRYAPASPLITLNACTKYDLKYAFVGKPCDCRALKKYLKSDEKARKRIKYIFSFFCGGTPSEHASRQLIAALGAENQTLQSIQYRGNGWPGYATVVDKNGSYKMNYEQSWGKILGRTKQQFCRICPEGTGDAADISCGDAWKLSADKKPDFSDSEGRNIVFLRSEKGERLFTEAVKEGVIVSEDYDIGELKYIQPYQYERKTTLITQIAALRLGGKYTPDFSWKQLRLLAKNASFHTKIRIFLGTCKRIIKGSIK